MAPTDTDQGSVLIVRVWFEPGPRAEGFRARIISTADVASGDRQTVVARSPDIVLDAVRHWLAEITA
ncbi:MAG TPA: hypothetical protein VFR67_27515 [Pilimelia sp.]|nr:hypothetical protein [Pilimelia sp.]